MRTQVPTFLQLPKGALVVLHTAERVSSFFSKMIFGFSKNNQLKYSKMKRIKIIILIIVFGTMISQAQRDFVRWKLTGDGGISWEVKSGTEGGRTIV